MRTLQRLFDHMRWADQRTLSGLRSLSEPPQQAVDLFAHLLTAEHVWLSRIEQKRPTYDVWQSLTLDECERVAHNNANGFAALLSASNAARLDAPVHYTNTRGKSFDTLLRDILLHVSHHGMYHRGQVALLIRLSGGTPMPTDFIVYVREHS